MKQKDRKLVLEDGSVYTGYGFGYPADRVCEIVFNTSMVGYQEIVSDLSYTDQAVVMTYPLIGNYGVADDDYETDTPTIGGAGRARIQRQPVQLPLHQDPVRGAGGDTASPASAGVDTRRLTRSIRDYGTPSGLLTDASTRRVRTALRAHCEARPCRMTPLPG